MLQQAVLALKEAPIRNFAPLTEPYRELPRVRGQFDSDIVSFPGYKQP